jgi:16S rRNA (cytosine967-C5)-methyltransferase
MNARNAPHAPGTEALAAAAAALARVVEQGSTAEDALAHVAPAAGHRAASRAILAGSLRWYLRLQPALEGLMAKGRRPQPVVHALLVAAAHQIVYSRAPAESVVNIAVDATRALRVPAASGFVNAVLRRFVREAEERLAAVDRKPAAAHAYPRWLVQALESAHGRSASAVMAAGNEHPPMTLRVDLSRGSREAAIAELAAAGIDAAPGLLPSALVLSEPVAVEVLPGFAEGRLSVQDAGAQLAAWFVDAQPGERVLDACAAPGGKTGHLLEYTPGLAEVVALDSAPARLERVALNLERLQRHAHLVCADFAAEPTWWDGRPFDRILLDAPCSATGVIRRHPDIKLLRRASDIAGFAAQQLAMLRQAARLLKPGGRLVYATCSVLPQENGEIIARLLEEGGTGLRPVPSAQLRLPPGVEASEQGLQLLPSLRSAGAAAATDGFYYACLTSGGGGAYDAT